MLLGWTQSHLPVCVFQYNAQCHRQSCQSCISSVALASSRPTHECQMVVALSQRRRPALMTTCMPALAGPRAGGSGGRSWPASHEALCRYLLHSSCHVAHRVNPQKYPAATPTYTRNVMAPRAAPSQHSVMNEPYQTEYIISKRHNSFIKGAACMCCLDLQLRECAGVYALSPLRVSPACPL